MNLAKYTKHELYKSLLSERANADVIRKQLVDLRNEHREAGRIIAKRDRTITARNTSLENCATALLKARQHRDRLLDERDVLVKDRDERMADHATEQDAIMDRLAKEYPGGA